MRVRTPAPLALAHDRQGSTRTVIDNSPPVERMAIQCVLYRTIVRLFVHSSLRMLLTIAKFQKMHWLRGSRKSARRAHSPFLFPPLPLHWVSHE